MYELFITTSASNSVLTGEPSGMQSLVGVLSGFAATADTVAIRTHIPVLQAIVYLRK